MATVIFEVTCPSTRPGECVYVIGGPDALGGWKVEKALALATNADRFPIWSSGQVTFASDTTTTEYKILVRKEGLPASAAIWERFASNRQLEVVTGQQLTATSVWDKTDGTVLRMKDVAPKPAPPPAAEVERVAEGAVENARELAERLEEREPMRKNFSQSLLCVDVESEEEGSEEVSHRAVEEAEEAPQPKKALRAMTTDFSEMKQAQPKARRAATTELRQTPPRHSANLKGISSFSCLTALAEVEDKEIARSVREGSKYKPYNLDVPVVIVTSEVAPYSKTGGLGLVAASYCYEFPRKGHRTMVVSPKYKHFGGISWVGETKVIVNGCEEVVKFWHKFVSCGDDKSGCDHIFVDHNAIERAGGLYNGDDGREYGDNLFRFTLLSMAAMEAPLILNLNGRGTYGDKVLFMANDWQAGLVPFYLNHKYRRNGCYMQSRAIYVIHNLGYQGQYPHVPACHFFGVDQGVAKDLEFGDCVNLSKAALLNADRVIAVSPTYAQEIRTQGGGFWLESFVSRQGDLLRLGGILNGIDDVWNPETDKDVHFNYSVKNFIEGKRANKAKLQETLGLNQDPDAVLLGFCGRLTWQKGVDIMVQIVDWLMADTGNGVTGRAQLIMMGQGERQYADALRWGEGTYPGRVCGYVGFDPKVEHLMMAGCDLLLMPSRYEPCGLPQMCAQRYGTLPIVTATGGLADSVKDVSIGVDRATGFHMSPLTKDKMSEVVYKACEWCLKRPAEFWTMQKTAMLEDFYWPQAMDEYEKAIDQTLYDLPLPR